MGQNRKMAQVESYPHAFLTAIESGGGLMYAEDLPWTTISSAKRFRLCLALIKSHPDHPLYAKAMQRWSVTAGSRALEVTAHTKDGMAPSLSGALVAKALST